MGAPDMARTADGSPRTVLLVDDDDAVRHFLTTCLARTGHTIVAARDGADALDILKRTQPEIHLLVTDVDMPNMSGTELAAIMTAALPQCEVLLVSGKPLPAEADGHGWEFLPKPFTPDVSSRSSCFASRTRHPPLRQRRATKRRNSPAKHTKGSLSCCLPIKTGL